MTSHIDGSQSAMLLVKLYPQQLKLACQVADAIAAKWELQNHFEDCHHVIDDKKAIDTMFYPLVATACLFYTEAIEKVAPTYLEALVEPDETIKDIASMFVMHFGVVDAGMGEASDD